MKKIGVLVIVFSMLFTITIAPIFADNVVNSTSSKSADITLYTDDVYGSCHILVTVTSLRPYIYNIDDSSNTSFDYIDIAQDYMYMVRIYNTTEHTIMLNRGLVAINAQRPAQNATTFTPKGYGNSISNINGKLLDSFSVSTAGVVWGYVSSQYSFQNMITVPPKSSIYSFFTVTSIETYANDLSGYSLSDFDRPVSSVSVQYPTSGLIRDDAILYNDDYNSYLTLDQIEDIYNQLITATLSINNVWQQSITNTTNTNNILNSIDSNVQNITDAYTNNQQNTTNTQSNISTVTSNEATLHQAEQNFYQQNEQALQNVGLSNFSFSGDQSSGLGSVITDFTTLWNNIGPLQIIFTFTLSMSLATFLLRHKPVTGAIKKNQQK